MGHTELDFNKMHIILPCVLFIWMVALLVITESFVSHSTLSFYFHYSLIEDGSFKPLLYRDWDYYYMPYSNKSNGEVKQIAFNLKIKNVNCIWEN